MTHAKIRLLALNQYGLTSSFTRPLAALRQLVLHRVTSRSLRHLDSYMLRDIGLNQCDVEAAMRQLGHR